MARQQAWSSHAELFRPAKHASRRADVNLKFAEAVSSRTAAEGDPVYFVLAEDLKVGNLVMAKAGAKVLGTVKRRPTVGSFRRSCE